MGVVYIKFGELNELDFNEEFLKDIFNRYRYAPDIPENKQIIRWIDHLLEVMFPERKKYAINNLSDIAQALRASSEDLLFIMQSTEACKACHPENTVKDFYKAIPLLFKAMQTDIKAIFNGDPAAKSEWEVIRTYPGFYAIAIYRIAHLLLKLKVPLLPRILSEHAHSKTGIDIHPGAEIGLYFFIDHGTGVVIGETTKIGKNVKIYQGVTLGAKSISKDLAGTKRHPSIEDNVIIYAGATILGGDTVIGHDSIIGGNVWLTESVPPYSRVYHYPEIKLVQKNDDK